MTIVKILAADVPSIDMADASECAKAIGQADSLQGSARVRSSVANYVSGIAFHRWVDIQAKADPDFGAHGAQKAFIEAASVPKGLQGSLSKCISMAAVLSYVLNGKDRDGAHDAKLEHQAGLVRLHWSEYHAERGGNQGDSLVTVLSGLLGSDGKARSEALRVMVTVFGNPTSMSGLYGIVNPKPEQDDQDDQDDQGEEEQGYDEATLRHLISTAHAYAAKYGVTSSVFVKLAHEIAGK
jgi:hypothetical protein